MDRFIVYSKSRYFYTVLVVCASVCVVEAVEVAMTPNSAQVIAVGDSVVFSCTGSGAIGTLSYKWTFQNGTPVSYEGQNPGTVVFNKDAEGKVNECVVTVTDEKSGLTCGTVSTSINVYVPKVQLGSLSRVPVFGSNPNGGNEKSVDVKITPALPSGSSIHLKLSTQSDSGEASFADGTAEADITSTGTVKIRGKTNSTTANNIKLSAMCPGSNSESASTTFTVSTWPYGLRNDPRDHNLRYGLSVDVRWESESGDVRDLTNIRVFEKLKYTERPNQLFVHALAEGLYPADGFIGTTPEKCVDEHFYEPMWVNYSRNNTGKMTCDQTYLFKDLVLGISNDLGKATIDRIVGAIGVINYSFTTIKTGPDLFVDVCEETYR